MSESKDGMQDGKAPEVLAVAIIFFIISWIAVGLRIWVRAGIIRAFGRDDWTMLATQLLFTAYLACQLGGVVYGTGRHLSDLEPARAERAMGYWFFCELSYIAATSTLKVSIGFFLLRVATQKLHVWIIRFVMVVDVVFGTAFFFVVLFQCNPIRAFWTLNPNDGTCIPVNTLNGLTYAVSGLNVVADWVFGLLPIFIVRSLQMSTRQKRLVACLLAFAAIGSTATIVRLPFVGTLTQSYLGWDGDFLYATVGVAIWTTVEVGVGITAGCIATLRPLVTMTLNHFGIRSSNAASRASAFQLPKRNKNHRAHAHSMSLGGLHPGHGVVTTITGNHDQKGLTRHSASSSQERLHVPTPKEGDIVQCVVVETDEYNLRSETPGNQEMLDIAAFQETPQSPEYRNWMGSPERKK